MKFTVKVDMGGSAFHGEGRTRYEGPELARILRRLADQVEDHGRLHKVDVYVLRDSNGNTVGEAKTR